jgi:GT2 family glycosyltransferase
MTNFVIGIPRLNEKELLIECMEGVLASTKSPVRLFVVDNGEEVMPIAGVAHPDVQVIRPVANLGVSGSWNLLMKLARPLPIVLLNVDMKVAPDTFEKMFEVASPAIVCAWGFGCVRIDPEIWNRIGDFDERFWPAYYEDADYRRRCKLAGVHIHEWSFEPRTEVSPGRTRSHASGMIHGKAEFGWRGPGDIGELIEANKRRYVEKWGGMPTEEKFENPC